MTLCCATLNYYDAAAVLADSGILCFKTCFHVYHINQYNSKC